MPADVALVGGGYRGVSLLASEHRLWPRVDVWESDSALGRGGFSRWAIESTSVGSRFFKDVDFSGLERSRASRAVYRVAHATRPVLIPALGRALGEVGAELAERVAGLHLGRRVSAVRVSPEGATLVDDTGAGHEYGHVILATGRGEVFNPELGPWKNKVVKSSDLITEAGIGRLRGYAASGAQRVAIVGASHSALSVLGLILEARRSTRHRLAATILQRTPTALMYPTLREALRAVDPARERAVGPSSVCRQTGIVHRDSGLRHRSRDLYCAAFAGAIPDVRVARAPSIGAHAAELDDADVIVQATGYVGTGPTFVVDGSPWSGRFWATDEGAPRGWAPAFARRVSFCRVEPTPPDRSDCCSFGAGLYRSVAGRALAASS